MGECSLLKSKSVPLSLEKRIVYLSMKYRFLIKEILDIPVVVTEAVIRLGTPKL